MIVAIDFEEINYRFIESLYVEVAVMEMVIQVKHLVIVGKVDYVFVVDWHHFDPLTEIVLLPMLEVSMPMVYYVYSDYPGVVVSEKVKDHYFLDLMVMFNM